MTKRKHIRIALTPDDYKAFQDAKSATEDIAGIAMSDAMFALSVIRHNLKARIAIDQIVNGLSPKQDG